MSNNAEIESIVALMCAVGYCAILVVSLVLFCFYIVCFIDLVKRKSTGFDANHMWLILFVVGLFLPIVGIIASVAYYMKYRPKLAFWRK